MFSPGRFSVMIRRYCKLVSITASVSGPRFDSVESFFCLFFCPSSLFFPSLFQLDFTSWHGFNPYQIPIFFYHSFSFLPFFFLPFALFSLPFLSSSNVFLPFFPAFLPFFFLLFFSHSCFLFSSPFCCFSFSLFLKSLLCYRISNWFTHVQVRKSLN